MGARLLAIHPVLAARDVRQSLRFYALLGFEEIFADSASSPRYAVVRRDGLELHLQWADPQQWAYPTDRAACRFYVHDVEAMYEEFAASGAATAESADGSPWALPADTPWGTREFHLRDPAGNSLQFYRAL
ncbi:bleomycin resistance protein [Arenimonas sp.]|uniref:bleomycin resistance protein n=1 Tax=Arenimonas sp. TaxID=1872635 RepID=UPI0039E29F55